MSKIQIDTAMGAITAELFDEEAPKTIANLRRLVAARAFDGGTFHRTVSPDTSGNEFLEGDREVQELPDGSVPITVVQAGPRHGWRDFPPIELESTGLTGIRHRDGTLSMGRLAPDSATSAFFICLGDQPELDEGGARNPDRRGFAAFGRVTEGMEIVRSIHDSPAAGQTLTPPIEVLRVTILGLTAEHRTQ